MKIVLEVFHLAQALPNSFSTRFHHALCFRKLTCRDCVSGLPCPVTWSWAILGGGPWDTRGTGNRKEGRRKVGCGNLALLLPPCRAAVVGRFLLQKATALLLGSPLPQNLLLLLTAPSLRPSRSRVGNTSPLQPALRYRARSPARSH